jgi:hypothetical protein
MDDWAKEFYKAVETVATEVDRIFQEVVREIDDWVEEWVEVSEEFSTQVEETLRSTLPIDEMAAQFDQYLQESLDPLFELYLDLEFDLDQRRDEDDPFVPVTYVPPTAEKNSACMGCQHYHGQIYGNNLLVCGMHPYGWEGASCPDWESDSLN